MYSDEGTIDGVCTTIRCRYGKIKPSASFYNKHEGRWVCMSCAQEVNKFALQHNLNPPCISGREHILNLLKE